MSQRLKGLKDGAEATVRDIRRRTRKQYAAEEKIRIVVAGLRGEDSIAELCRREGIAESLYYSWSKEFLEAGKLGGAAGAAVGGLTDEDDINLGDPIWNRDGDNDDDDDDGDDDDNLF